MRREREQKKKERSLQREGMLFARQMATKENVISKDSI